EQAADDLLAFRHENLLLAMLVLAPHGAVGRQIRQVQSFDLLNVQHDFRRSLFAPPQGNSNLVSSARGVQLGETLPGLAQTGVNRASKNANKSPIYVQPSFF